MSLCSRRVFTTQAATLLVGCALPGAGVPNALRSAHFILLGEVHDNAEHHRARAQLLHELLADGRTTRVLFEQMSIGTEAAIAEAPRNAEAVASAGRLDRKAWQWPLHKPLFEAALAAGATLGGASLERDAVRAVMREGASAAPTAFRPWLLDTRWTATQQATQELFIEHGHCGLLPRSQWQPMVMGQRARDAAMASAMLAAPHGERVVLLAGNGHVRRDVGVPYYLEGAGVPARDVASVGYTERGDDDPTHAAFDIVFTLPAASRTDPCAPLRERTPLSRR